MIFQIWLEEAAEPIKEIRRRTISLETWTYETRIFASLCLIFYFFLLILYQMRLNHPRDEDEASEFKYQIK